jgi:hypothetical protein
LLHEHAGVVYTNLVRRYARKGSTIWKIHRLHISYSLFLFGTTDFSGTGTGLQMNLETVISTELFLTEMTDEGLLFDVGSRVVVAR